MNRPQPVAADAMAISAEVGTEVESAKYNHQPQVSYIFRGVCYSSVIGQALQYKMAK